jgi:PAS domain S-box-containing protein
MSVTGTTARNETPPAADPDVPNQFPDSAPADRLSSADEATVTRSSSDGQPGGLPQQTSLFDALVEACSDAVIVITRDGLVSSWNPAAERLLGFSTAEVLGQPAVRLFADSDAIAGRIRSGQSGSGIDATVLHKEGRRIGVSITMSKVGEDALIIAREPDQSRRMREAGEINSLYRSAIENLPDCINIKDTSGRFLIANEATADLMQAKSAADLIGKTDFNFYPRPVAQTFQEDERKILQEGIPRVIEQEAFRRDGKWVLLSTLKVPLHDAAGNPAGLITLNRDVTQTRLLERQLVESREYLADALAHMPDGLAMFNASGAMLFCNEQFRAHFPRAMELCVPGSKLQDILQEAVARGEFLVPPAGLTEVLSKTPAELLRSLESKEYQLAGGRWIESRAKFTGSGECLLVSIDITARREAAKALEESEERYRVVADVTLEAWWEEDLQNGIVKHSRRFCEMLGLGDDMLECPITWFLDRIHPDDQSRATSDLTESFGIHKSPGK